jgi:hypothetical protein
MDGNAQRHFLDNISSKLQQHEQTDCDAEITTQELTAALHTMQNNKSPGKDGLTREFYTKFWNHLAAPLTEVANWNHAIESMSPSQREALLKLLYKKRTKEQLKNWRPISLLNTDYKIIAKALSLRLRQILPSLVNTAQTCSIPNRTIQENLATIRDVIHHTSDQGEAIIISVDQEKAFDRVDRDYMYRVLEEMNFGHSFIKWIKTLYANASAVIANNGWTSDPVFLHRGLRQGCPLSPLLYVLTVEPLAQTIRANSDIQGVHTPGGGGKETKLVQYADDMNLILANERSAIRAFEVLHEYQKASGSKMNLEKTEGMFFGTQAGRTNGPVPIRWRTDNLDILGVKINPHLRQDWETPLRKAEQHLHMWSSRKLTIRGRALIAKTFGIATFLYLLACFTAPSQIIDRITKLTFNFIWQNGVEYVGRKTLEKPLHRGGLGIPSFRNLSQMMKLNLALKITTPANDSNWALWSRYHIGWPLANITTAWAFLRDNSRPHLDPDKLPAWYKEIAEYLQNNSEALKQLAEATPQLTTKVLKQIGPEQPATRADQKWETLGIPEDTRAEEWKQLWSSLNTRDEQELKWRILHWTLPTKGYLSSWKRMQIDKKCPFCSEEETVTHALVTCTRVQKVWNYVNIIRQQLDQHEITTLPEAVFTQHDTALAAYMTTTTLFVIWQTRKNYLFGDGTKRDPIESLKRRIKQRIQIDLHNRKTTRLENIWATKNIFIQYERSTNTLTFKL